MVRLKLARKRIGYNKSRENMKLYLTMILTAMALIAGVNILAGTATWYYIIISVVWCTVLQFVLDGAIAIIVQKLPSSWFDANKRCFCTTERERALYKKLRVRKWKEKVWELGGLGGFSKRTIKEPRNRAYIERYILECNKGVVTHRASYFIGFLAMLTMYNVCTFTIAAPVALVNLFLNVLPTIILRDNVPRLKSALEHIRRCEERAKRSQAEELANTAQ